MRIRPGPLLLMFIFLASASMPVAAGQKDATTLKKRAKTFWEARVKGDWETVYSYLAKSEKERYASREAFVKFRNDKGPLVYLSYDILDVATDGQLGWVEVRAEMVPAHVPGYPATSIQQWEIWFKSKEGWKPLPNKLRASVPRLPPKLRPAGEEAALAKRAEEFWKAKETGNWKLIYDFLDPAFRSRVTAEEFLQRKAKYTYLSHSIKWTEVEGDRGRVKVDYSRRLNDPALYKLEPQDDATIENWIKVDNVWYRKMKEE